MTWRLNLIGVDGRVISAIHLPDAPPDLFDLDFTIPVAIRGLRAIRIAESSPPAPPVGAHGSIFGHPWAPEHEGSSDGDYGPDQIVTCLICGATIDDRSISGGRQSHVAWHRKHGDITPEGGPA